MNSCGASKATELRPAAASPWQELFAPISEQLEQTEKLLAELIDSCSVTVQQVGRHILGAGGKRLRPALVLLCAQACGQADQHPVRLAAAVELIHASSLLHDDVCDEAYFRHGTQSVWRQWGTSAAVLVGDFLVATVYQRLVKHEDTQVLSVLADTIVAMCEAELRSMECGNDVDEATYLEIIGGKTAALLSASCQLGAVTGGGDGAVQAALAEYGHNLGMVFQITDDLLDLYGRPDELGKSVGQDLTGKHLTLPVIYALGNDDGGEVVRLVDKLAGDGADPTTVAMLAARVAEAGGRSYAGDCARNYATAAVQKLSILPPSESKDALTALPDEILGRCY